MSDGKLLVLCKRCKTTFILQTAFAGNTECPGCGELIDVQARIRDDLGELEEDVKRWLEELDE